MIDYSLQLFYYFNLSSGLCTECEALLSRLQKPHFCGRHEIRTPRCLLSATPPPPGWGSVGHGRPPPRHAAPHSLAGRWQQSVASRPGPPAGCPGEGALPPAMGPALRRRAFVRAGSAPSSGAGREASCLEVQRRKSLGASRIKQRMDCSLSIRANTITFFGGKNLRRCYFAQNSRLKTPTALLSLLAQVSLSARSVKCGGKARFARLFAGLFALLCVCAALPLDLTVMFYSANF